MTCLDCKIFVSLRKELSRWKKYLYCRERIFVSLGKIFVSMAKLCLLWRNIYLANKIFILLVLNVSLVAKMLVSMIECLSHWQKTCLDGHNICLDCKLFVSWIRFIPIISSKYEYLNIVSKSIIFVHICPSRQTWFPSKNVFPN